MKKFLIYFGLMFFMLGLITTTACGGDDDDASNIDKSIVGTWRHDFGDGYQLLTLEKNGSYSLVEIDYVSGNWSETGTYSIKGNIMTRYLSDGDVEVYTILTLTSAKFVERYEGSYVGEYPDYSDKDITDWTRIE